MASITLRIERQLLTLVPVPRPSGLLTGPLLRTAFCLRTFASAAPSAWAASPRCPPCWLPVCHSCLNHQCDPPRVPQETPRDSCFLVPRLARRTPQEPVRSLGNDEVQFPSEDGRVTVTPDRGPAHGGTGDIEDSRRLPACPPATCPGPAFGMTGRVPSAPRPRRQDPLLRLYGPGTPSRSRAAGV